MSRLSSSMLSRRCWMRASSRLSCSPRYISRALRISRRIISRKYPLGMGGRDVGIIGWW